MSFCLLLLFLLFFDQFSGEPQGNYEGESDIRTTNTTGSGNVYNLRKKSARHLVVQCYAFTSELQFENCRIIGKCSDSLNREPIEAAAIDRWREQCVSVASTALVKKDSRNCIDRARVDSGYWRQEVFT